MQTSFRVFISFGKCLNRPIHLKMYSNYVYLLCISLISLSSAYKIIWDNEIEIDLNEIDPELRSEERRIPNWFLIYPGTKWCGAGNIANNSSDLGKQRDTDKCCRTHDMCSDIIEGHQTKYNLTNPSFYSRLICDCDDEFYKCLKSVNTKTSNQVGHLYFTVLGTQCYKYDYPIKGCKKYTAFPRRKCIKYELDTSKPKQWQWFDVKNY